MIRLFQKILRRSIKLSTKCRWSIYNVELGEQLTVSKAEAYEFANTVRDSVISTEAKGFSLKQSNIADRELSVLSSSNNAEELDIDTSKLISASLNGTLIENAQFFLANPKRGENYDGVKYGEVNSGTSGPVAAQLLLGYNNFYNDRRIIPDKYLNGYDHTTNTISVREKTSQLPLSAFRGSRFLLSARGLPNSFGS